MSNFGLYYTHTFTGLTLLSMSNIKGFTVMLVTTKILIFKRFLKQFVTDFCKIKYTGKQFFLDNI
jgi:hypothetical protein